MDTCRNSYLTFLNYNNKFCFLLSDLRVGRRAVVATLSFLASGAFVLTILSVVLCEYMTIDLPRVERLTGEVIDAYKGPAGLSAPCRPEIPYMGGVQYSSAFAMAICSAMIGFGATIITCFAVTQEVPIPMLCGLSYAFATSSVLVGMTLTLFRAWECDEGSCAIGPGAGTALGAALLWMICAVVACVIPVRVPPPTEPRKSEENKRDNY